MLFLAEKKSNSTDIWGYILCALIIIILMVNIACVLKEVDKIINIYHYETLASPNKFLNILVNCYNKNSPEYLYKYLEQYTLTYFTILLSISVWVGSVALCISILLFFVANIRAVFASCKSFILSNVWSVTYFEDEYGFKGAKLIVACMAFSLFCIKDAIEETSPLKFCKSFYIISNILISSILATSIIFVFLLSHWYNSVPTTVGAICLAIYSLCWGLNLLVLCRSRLVTQLINILLCFFVCGLVAFIIDKDGQFLPFIVSCGVSMILIFLFTKRGRDESHIKSNYIFYMLIGIMLGTFIYANNNDLFAGITQYDNLAKEYHLNIYSNNSHATSQISNAFEWYGNEIAERLALSRNNFKLIVDSALKSWAFVLLIINFFQHILENALNKRCLQRPQEVNTASAPHETETMRLCKSCKILFKCNVQKQDLCDDCKDKHILITYKS